METTHRIGIIGGSGLYDIEGFEGREWKKVETPWGDPSDEFLMGTFAGREVVFLPRHGRGHRISPSELNHRANIYAMKSLGVRWILSASAVGSLQPQYKPRDIVVIDQFFDRTKRHQDHTFFGNGIVAHVSFAHPICEDLRQLALTAAKECEIPVHDGGVYVNMEGPAFSTKAESLFHQKMGFDVIGMTNLGEAKCCREAQISYATLALVTDYDCWHEEEEHVTVELVLENLKHNAQSAKTILAKTIPTIPTEPTWETHRSLETAILTPPDAWSPETKDRISLLTQ